ncbi:hypothetical protein [Pseudomonas sp. 9.1(2019)]|uniref:hypothetical protein n=1 Tax=Pseudomonas sp. 9.1(2019) TaxID=2580568 RepID=UPI00136A7A5E|nr:hypothetical protein [Pseudomonas sp. 9.1(2019)]MCH4869707.1 hypothetical protein [Pseudomonas sp. TMW22089]NBG93542.1 hypothetical protein [Pseudomonas sp. 9.1(2019)]
MNGNRFSIAKLFQPASAVDAVQGFAQGNHLLRSQPKAPAQGWVGDLAGSLLAGLHFKWRQHQRGFR